MQSNFDLVFEKLVELEGGYSNNPNDPGGETSYGISKRSYPNLHIPSLTKDQAKEIYRNDWWNEKYDNIDPGVAWEVFEMAVNMGANQAHKLLQGALNELGSDLKVDGVFGIKTLTAVRKVDPKWLADKLKLAAVRYYLNIVKNRERSKVFLVGWIERALA